VMQANSFEPFRTPPPPPPPSSSSSLKPFLFALLAASLFAHVSCQLQKTDTLLLRYIVSVLHSVNVASTMSLSPNNTDWGSLENQLHQAFSSKFREIHNQRLFAIRMPTPLMAEQLRDEVGHHPSSTLSM
jgi:hypothetical protein